MKALLSMIGAFVTIVVASPAMAQYDTSVTLTPEETAEVTAATAGGLAGLFAAGVTIAVILGVVGLAFLALWIWALVDVLGRSFKEEKTKKTWMWLVILAWPLPVVMGFIPGLNYLSPFVGIAGVIIVIVYLASIRKQGTKAGEKAPAKPEETK